MEKLQNILQKIETIETEKFYQVSQYEFASIPTKGLQLTLFKDYKLEKITETIENRYGFRPSHADEALEYISDMVTALDWPEFACILNNVFIFTANIYAC
ncbi:hypothetical protein K492DRAFT_201608 [Lichtheimia hyalospora FSU 10163]|nr:hypothetical protein K492DRAFT_201608 [Lichtheimia hyalospora FSU 10163]